MRKFLFASVALACLGIALGGASIAWTVASVDRSSISPVSAHAAPAKNPILKVDGGGGM